MGGTGGLEPVVAVNSLARPTITEAGFEPSGRNKKTLEGERGRKGINKFASVYYFHSCYYHSEKALTTKNHTT